MKKYVACVAIVMLGVGLLLTTSAQATVLTFNDLTFNGLHVAYNSFQSIPAAYGDNVNALSDAVGSYGMGNGFTPNIMTTYATVDISTGVVTHDDLLPWLTNYGDLVNVAYANASTGHYGQITLVPDAGEAVRLNSFDLAGWFAQDQLNQPVQILDGANNIVTNYGPITIHGANGTHSTFSPNYVSAGPITIRFGNNHNVGIDNINFDQVGPTTNMVPEPGTLLLFGAGLAGLAAWKRNRQ